MKGVKINNYIDNRIVLSGKKLKNQVQTLIQSNQPVRPIVIRNVNYFQQEEQPLATQDKQPLKAIQSKSNKKKKKKTSKITTNNNLEQVNEPHLSKQQKKPKKIRQDVRKTSAKKRSAESSASKGETENLNSTEKKGKGLGKRCKSAIIKRNKSPSNVGFDLERKLFNQTIATSTQNKKKKQVKDSSNKKKKQGKQKQKKTINKKPKQFKKNISPLNITQRRKNSQSGLKSSRPNSKTLASSTKQLKPMSARQNKRSQQPSTSNRKFFQSNQKPKQKQFINILELFGFENKDKKMKGAMAKLQEVLSDESNCRKLPEIIELIAEKLRSQRKRQLMYDQSDDQPQDNENQSMNQSLSVQKDDLRLKIKKQEEIKKESSQQQDSPNQEVSEQQDKQSKNSQRFSNAKIAQQIRKKQQSSQKDGQILVFQTPKREQHSIKQPQDQQTTKKHKQPQKQPSALPPQKKDIYMKDPDTFRKILNRQDGNYSNDDNSQTNQNIKNALIGRKAVFDPEPYVSNGSVNSYDSNPNPNDSRKQQIKELIEFGRSMNEKMKSKQSNKPEQDNKKDHIKIEQNISQSMNKSGITGHNSPRNLQLSNYTLQKYPKMPQSLTSPKFNPTHLLQLLKTKQKTQTDKHEKLSELVNLMYDRKLVSPKTYSLNIQSLRAQQAQNNQVLDSYKRHAEELMQLLGQIRKEKEEIVSIDEMIRMERWDLAVGVVKGRGGHGDGDRDKDKDEGVSVSGSGSGSGGKLEDQVQESLKNDSIVSEKSVVSQPIKQQQTSFGFKLQPVIQQNTTTIPTSQRPKQKQTDQIVYYSGEQSQNSEDAHNNKLTQLDSSQNSAELINNLIKIDNSDGEGGNVTVGGGVDNGNGEGNGSGSGDGNGRVVKKQRGFDSNLFFIKEYCIALCQYVRDNHKDIFRANIGQPMSYNLIQLLKNFRTTKSGNPPTTTPPNSLLEQLQYHTTPFHNNTAPITLQIFTQFNQLYPSLKYYGQGREQSQDAQLECIFLRSVYDALNESISVEKPGSLAGRALPWAHSSRHLRNLRNMVGWVRDAGQDSEDLIFGVAIARIIQWGSCLCGFIPDTVQLENTQIDQQYINHIRQTRTALLLQKMLVDEQASMYRTELEETEVKLGLGEVIWAEIVREAVEEVRRVWVRGVIRGTDY